MRVLVTGATGFVGSHLVEALRDRGDEVTALARSPTKAAPLSQAGVRVVPGDLHDPTALHKAVADQDVVFHVAGMIAAKSETEFLRANRDGTANLVDTAQRTGRPRLIFVSSMAAGGPSRPGQPLRGDEPPAPLTQYGRSKLEAEAVVRASPLPWCIVRPPVVYGPRDYEILKVFRFAKRGIAPILGDGRQEISTIYAPDLARAIIATATAPAAVGRIYYACDPVWTTSAGFMTAVGEAMGRTILMVPVAEPIARGLLSVTGAAAALTGRATLLTRDKAKEFFAPAWTGDPATLTRETGWVPASDLAGGLRATAAWYREAGWL